MLIGSATSPRQIQVRLRMTFLSPRLGGTLGRRGLPEVARCASVDQPAENEIPAVLGPTPLDDILNATRPNTDDPSTDKSLSESDAPVAPLRRSTQQKRSAPSCTVCNRNEGAQDKCGSLPLDTKECTLVSPSHCAKRDNFVHTNVVPKRARLKFVIWRSRGRVFIRVQRCKVKSGRITDHSV